MKTTHLNQLGWNIYTSFNTSLTIPQDNTIGRIAAQYNELYSVLTGSSELQGMLSGSFYYTKESLPVVGDWVLLRELEGENKCIISDILPRKNSLERKKIATRGRQQVMIANLDMVFIVQGLDHDFNPRRLERYIVMCKKNNIEPVALFNKCDLAADTSRYEQELKHILGNVPAYFISAVTQQGTEQLNRHLQPGQTAALVGSSGAGKSTLTNLLTGEKAQAVNKVRSDDSKGRHTTTIRQMFMLGNGALLIDTPGMRELEPWDALDTIDDIFDDIARLAKQCRYRDCSHEHEPGCRVQQAVKDGHLEPKRLINYKKMLREQEYQRLMADEKGHIERRRKDKEFGKMCKRIIKEKKL